MANNKDFKVKNGIQPTVYHEAVGTVVSGAEGYYLAGTSYDSVSLSVTSQIGTPTGIFFKPDGTKIFIVDLTNNDISEYSLSTAWDLTTASYVTAFSISSQDTSPWGIFFKSDGTVLYLIGRANDTVFQYTLSTAWDISTASYASKSFSVASQDTVPNGLFFKSDGTKMYVAGTGNDNIYQYTLSTAYDVSTASYDSVSIDISGQTSGPTGLVFHPDGGYFYLTGGGSVFKYSLSTAWDLSTATYSSVTADLTGTQDTSTYNLAFKSDGTKMYVVSGNADTIYQYSTALSTRTLDQSTGSVFEITPTSDIQIGLSNPADSGTVSAATLLLDGDGSPSNNISNISYANQSFTFSEETVIMDITFKPDGTKLYMAGQGNDYIYQYTLSTAWDVSTASYDSVSFSIAAQDTLPSDVAFKPDGTKMYLLGNSSNSVKQYSLSTAWDISTASYDSVTVTSTDTTPGGFVFKPDGTKMYIVGALNDNIYQYTLSTAWDLSTASYDSVSLSVASQEGVAGGLAVNTEGTKFLVCGNSTDTIYQYGLTTAWDLSTGSYDSVSYTPTETPNPMGLYWYNGEKLFVSSQISPYTLAAYNTATAYTITYDSTIEFAGGTAPTSPAVSDTDVLTFSTRDGGTSYQSVLAIDGAA